MQRINYSFNSSEVECVFDASFSEIGSMLDKSKTIIITDENIETLHAEKFEGWQKIVIKPGETIKQQYTVDDIIRQLISLNADRNSVILGIGGGVISDISGYVASIYMRGINCSFVPTTILAMVDAAIGGKNGIDVGMYKNMVGSIRHPQFLFYDYDFLETLPEQEWINGFAEIIKHACIADRELFEELENSSISAIRQSREKIDSLIRRNVFIKYDIVSKDELEQGVRKYLNFGHTIGHAIENICSLPHGYAVSIGMNSAGFISQEINSFSYKEYGRLINLLKKYDLPVTIKFDKEKAWEILIHDKKRSGKNISFVVLENIGRASVKVIPLSQLKLIFNTLF